MACFVAPAAVAIIMTAARKKIPHHYHIEWLNTMLWGGVIMLVVDHIATGEIMFAPPFLTAMQNPADVPIMFKEIATTGAAMTAAVVAAWAAIVIAVNKLSVWRKNSNNHAAV